MEGELIFMALIMLIGQVILLQMWQHNWFKKENFKIKKKQDEGEIKLRFRRLEKELGLKPSKAPAAESTNPINQLLPLLKNLNEDQIAGVIGAFAGGEEEEPGVIGSILDNLPPELIEKGAKIITGAISKEEEEPGEHYLGE